MRNGNYPGHLEDQRISIINKVLRCSGNFSATNWRESIQVWTLGGQSSLINYVYDWRVVSWVTSLTTVMVMFMFVVLELKVDQQLWRHWVLSYDWRMFSQYVVMLLATKGLATLIFIAAVLFLSSVKLNWSDDKVLLWLWRSETTSREDILLVSALSLCTGGGWQYSSE